MTTQLPLLGLAPMEGVTCAATRLWLGLVGGFDFAMTPFLRITPGYPVKRIPLVFSPESHWAEASKGRFLYQLVPQLMGQSVSDLAPIADSLLKSASFVDFNCGCPSPTVVGNGAGSGLLRSASGFGSYVRELVGALGASQVSIKMRVGFDRPEEFVGLLDEASQFQLAQWTVHGRTRAERYTGHSRWNLIQEARLRGLTVVGSGDLVSSVSFQERMAVAQPAKVIIGRGALRNPFVFQEVRTGQVQWVSHELFFEMLTVALRLHHMLESDPEKLLEWGSALGDPAGTHASLWRAHRTELETEMLHKPVPRGSFAKLKMIWNYLRTSLPSSVPLDASCLRATDVSAFWQALEELLKHLPDPFPLQHRPEFDWIFSGAGKTGA